MGIDHHIPSLINGYTEFVEEQVEQGWKPYFLSVLFKLLKFEDGPIVFQMQSNMERVYGELAKLFTRHPRSRSGSQSLPHLIGWLDRPVPKYTKKHIAEVRINDGLHFHALLMLPPKSRFKDNLILHFHKHDKKYRGHSIQRIHIEPVTHALDQVVDYGMKSLKRYSVDPDDILILPRALSERQRKASSLSRYERRIRDIQSRFNLSNETARESLESIKKGRR